MLLEYFELESLCGGPLCKTYIANHRRVLSPNNTKPILSTPCQTGSRARGFEGKEIGRMVLREVTQPTQTERAGQIAFAPKKDGFLCFCAGHWARNAFTKQDVYPIKRTVNSSVPLAKVRSSLRKMQAASIGKFKLKMNMETGRPLLYITDIVALWSCNLNYVMLQVRFCKPWMLCFPRFQNSQL